MSILAIVFLRMLRNPSLYGIPVEARDDDPKLEQWRANLVHTAAVQLEKSHLIKYDRKAGNFQVKRPMGGEIGSVRHWLLVLC